MPLQLQQLQQQLEEARTDNAGLLSRLHEWHASSRRGSGSGTDALASCRDAPNDSDAVCGGCMFCLFVLSGGLVWGL